MMTVTGIKRTRSVVKKEEEETAAIVETVAKTKEEVVVEIKELPQEFIDAHTEEFIKCCRQVLKVDPTLLPVLAAGNFSHHLKKSTEIKTDTPEEFLQDCFAKLGGAIVGQQISNTAAKNIRDRLCNHFGGNFPGYQILFDSLQDPEKRVEIKACGLSARKVDYMESLATYFTQHTKEVEALFTGADNDQEIIDALVGNVKGIGPWSANMFLVNALRRPNVFTPDDLGIARGFSNYASQRPKLVAELMKERTIVKKSKIKHKKYNWKIYDSDIMESCAQRFQPNRTLFMFLLWRLSSDDIQFMVKMQEEFMAS